MLARPSAPARIIHRGASTLRLPQAAARWQAQGQQAAISALQNSGLVARHAYAEAPPRVEYKLTELDRTLIDPIRMLAQWAEANGDAILDAQEHA